jgi:hypothetical protein
MTDTNQKITHLLADQIPDYVQEYFPIFVIFVTKYFDYLQNTSTGVQTTIQNLQLNRDVDTTATDLAKQFLHTYMPGLPDNTAADPGLLVKYFRQFYQLKGSPESFRIFFRAFFDDEIEVHYPRNALFNTSDGDYYKETTVRVRKNAGDPYNLEHTYVTGLTSSAYAVVDRVIKLNALGANDYYDLVLQPASWIGSFSSGETIRGIYYDHTLATSSIVSVSSVGTASTAPGVYRNSRSQLSNDQVLQDSLYYQQFSYVIRSHTDRELWADHVLKQIHPAGTVIFNDYNTDDIADFSTGNVTSIGINTVVSSTIKIPVEKTYLTAPTYTFDRTADEQTGTSTTQVATTTGFTTVTYTSIGAITRSASYDYPGENITWALQLLNDGYTITEITRPEGPSFDKFSRSVNLNQQLIAWPRDVNTSIVTTRYKAASSIAVAGTLLTSFSSQTLRYSSALDNATSVGSMILVVNWAKTSQGNSPAGESSNAVVVSFSSNVAVIPYFGSESQRNYKAIALNDSLNYNSLIYFHSSNSISANLTPDQSFTATSISGQTGQIVFKPYNWERGTSYDRLSIRFAVDQSQQLNTSLTETFNTDNITATGLIASWSGATASAIRFTSNASSFYAFSSNAFVFNGTTSQSRFIRTPTFTNCAQLDASLKYIVGDNYNGGEIPDAGEDLEIQISLDAGANWYTAHKLWIGSTSNLWTYGTTSVSGKIWTQAGSTRVTGVNTIFATQLNVGDIITINSSLTTGYTITNIVNNNVIDITPAVVDTYLGLTTGTGTVSGGANGNTLTGVSTQFLTQFNLGDRITLSSASATTAYTIINIVDSSNVYISPILTDSFTTSIFYKIAGVDSYYKLPASRQFNNTSITVYGPGPTTSVIMRIIQNSQTTLNDDVYALDDLAVQSYNYQQTTGVVNISVAVSSNSTLNISDYDFFTITTIGS